MNPQTRTVLLQDIPPHLSSPCFPGKVAGCQMGPANPGSSGVMPTWHDGLSCAFRLLFYPQVSKTISEEIPFWL